jgi:MFS superfamily sulfate permease-like transporter
VIGPVLLSAIFITVMISCRPHGGLFGMGAGNAISAFFAGIPCEASSRTDSGMSPVELPSRLAHVYTSLILLICIVLLGRLFSMIPLSAIAGLILVIMVDTVKRWRKSQPKHGGADSAPDVTCV